MDFASLVNDTIPLTAPIITIYGKNNLGKSSIAAEFPNPIFIDLENGLLAPKRKHPNLKTWKRDAFTHISRVFDAIDYLKTQEHSFQTLVIDSLDGIEKIIQSSLLQDYNAKNQLAPCFSFGKWTSLQNEKFNELMDRLKALRDKTNIFVVLVSQRLPQNEVDPVNGDCQVSSLAIGKTAAKIITSHSDCVFYLAQSNTRDDDNSKLLNSTSTRYLYCTPNARYEAKNRFDMPQKLILTEGQTFSELMTYFTFQHPSQQLSPAA